jgi:hypothetical protein
MWEQATTTALDQLQILQMGYGPEVESASLMEVLPQQPGDPPHAAPPASVSLSAYKHRLQAIRCEYVHVHLRAIELEEQLAEARLQIARLENDRQYLDDQLNSMRQSRAWKMAARYIHWRQTIADWFKKSLTQRRKEGKKTKEKINHR